MNVFDHNETDIPYDTTINVNLGAIMTLQIKNLDYQTTSVRHLGFGFLDGVHPFLSQSK